MKETTANTEFGTKLANAIEAKKNDIEIIRTHSSSASSLNNVLDEYFENVG